ncbi:serine/threonine-protein kinase pim-2-like [Oratosquilla oratoria]|uniref:serine/threonine-protein kinase pim-2-like n=1 Tax=Oratosquilla oratoria TaxID=337810 RepID=UPI003F75E53F
MTDRFVFNSSLGQGAFGHVFSAERIEDRDTVAIKVVPKALICRWADPERRVPLEVALLQKVQHVQEVVQLDEYFFDRSSLYMVMELIPGAVDLWDYTSKVGNLENEDARSVFQQLVKAVSQCHAAGVIHGDIQLGNVLVYKDSETGSLRLKLLDFGMGKFVQEDTLSPKDHERASVYQLGEFLYYLLCHKFPFSAKSKSLRFPEHVGRSCRDLIRRCLEKEGTTLEDLNEHPWVTGQGGRKDKMTKNDAKKTSPLRRFLRKMPGGATRAPYDIPGERRAEFTRTVKKEDLLDWDMKTR